jgi:hypothetical protein
MSKPTRVNTDDDLNITALVKGSERYIFMFTDANRDQVLQTFGRFASNPDLSLTWYDAMMLSNRVRAAEDA